MANDTNDQLGTIKHDTNDLIDEAKHRAAAVGEKAKRAVAGDTMPLGDRVVSNVKETAHNTLADVDAAKRDIRHGAAAGTDDNP